MAKIFSNDRNVIGVTYTVEPHLGDEELDTYCRGGSDDSEVQRIERHLLDCADCARRVYEAVRALVRERRKSFE